MEEAKKDRLAAQIKQVKTLTLARQSFECAAHLARHLSKLELPHPRLYSACMTGIVVSYMRPFKANNGIGSIDKYHKLPTPELQATHNEMKTARDQFYAHYDQTRAGDLVFHPNAVGSVYETTIEFFDVKPGEPWMETRPIVTVPEIMMETLPEMAELIRFQFERVTTEITGLVNDLGGGKPYEVGRVYKLGVDFP